MFHFFFCSFWLLCSTSDVVSTDCRTKFPVDADPRFSETEILAQFSSLNVRLCPFLQKSFSIMVPRNIGYINLWFMFYEIRINFSKPQYFILDFSHSHSDFLIICISWSWDRLCGANVTCFLRSWFFLKFVRLDLTFFLMCIS